MKSSIYSVTVITIMIVTTIFGCKKDDSKNSLVFGGKLISKSECKSNFKMIVAPTPDTLSCVDYYFDKSTNKLFLNHINAAFNCCPDSVYCNISLENNTIVVREYESASPCDCDCIYDLNIEVNGIETKSYQIKFIEPYAESEDEILFNIDLESELSGSYCVVRKGYPWGMSSF